MRMTTFEVDGVRYRTFTGFHHEYDPHYGDRFDQAYNYLQVRGMLWGILPLWLTISQTPTSSKTACDAKCPEYVRWQMDQISRLHRVTEFF